MNISINGTVFLITNPKEFFAPLLLEVGGAAPTSGFETVDSPLVITMTIFGSLPGLPFVIPFSFSGALDTTNGTFSVEIPNAINAFSPQSAAMSISLYDWPVDRSASFGYFPTDYKTGRLQALSIYLYQPSLPTSDGISAGQISSVLSGHQLPGDTTLSSNSNGLNVVGSEGPTNLQFGIAITPDTSPNLGVYFDLALNGYNINVGWPESWCESANDVLNSIKSGLQTAGSAANNVVQSQLMTILQAAPLNLTATEANNLLKNVSIQFESVSFADYSWALSNKSDPTIVISPGPILGYPQAFYLQ
jgi:hypothetical protein